MNDTITIKITPFMKTLISGFGQSINAIGAILISLYLIDFICKLIGYDDGVDDLPPFAFISMFLILFILINSFTLTLAKL